MLFKKTVDEDRQGSETNIIQSQVYTVIEGLKMEIKIILRFEEKSCSHLLKVKSHNVSLIHVNLLIGKQAIFTI